MKMQEKVKTYKDLVEWFHIQRVLCNNMGKRLWDTMSVSSEVDTLKAIEYSEDEFEENEDLKEEFDSYEDYVENCDYYDIYQWYIIDDYSARMLLEYTDEIIFYDDELEVYVWGITHFGTGWDYVPFSNWK